MARTPSRATVIAAVAGVVTVVLGGAFLARSVFNGDEGSPGTNAAQAGQGPGGSAEAPAGSSGAGSPNADGSPPDVILVKQPTADFRALEYSPDDSTCLPAVRTEDRSLSGQMQVSAPRQLNSGQSVEFGMRFKYDQPSNYYVAAQVRPPGPHGSAGPGWVQSKPHLYPDEGGLDLTFPEDFRWEGSDAGGGTELREGVWTIVWMHVHPNGDAYYIGCDGFTHR